MSRKIEKSPYNQSLVANQIVNKGGIYKKWLNGMISNVKQPFFFS